MVKEYTEGVYFQFTGDEHKAQQLKGLGRKYLGELKGRMRQAKVDFHEHRVTTSDGVVFHVTSIMRGLRHIDKVKIFVPIEGGIKILGFIVRAFKNDPPTDYVKFRGDMDIRLPIKNEDDTYKHIGFYDDNEGSSTSHDNEGGEFTDYGAKYLNYYLDEEKQEYQVVYVNSHNTTINYSIYSTVQIGELTYFDLPALNTGWSWVTSYSVDSGTCGTDADFGTPVEWEFIADPCEGAEFLLNGDESTPGWGGDIGTGITMINHNVFYTGGYTHFVIPLFPDQCVKDQPEIYVGSSETVPPPVEVYGHDNYLNATALKPVIESINADYMQDRLNMQNNVNSSEFTGITLFASSTQDNVMNIYRREDDRGFISYSGITVGSNFVFQNLGTDGRLVGFMKHEKGEGYSFSYAPDVEMTTGTTIEDTLINQYNISTYETLAGNCPHVEFIGGPGQGNVLKRTDTNEYIKAGNFGIPVKVEDGWYKVSFRGYYTYEPFFQNKLFDNNKVDLYLYTNKGTYKRSFTLDYIDPNLENLDTIAFATTQSIRINVGQEVDDALFDSLFHVTDDITENY